MSARQAPESLVSLAACLAVVAAACGGAGPGGSVGGSGGAAAGAGGGGGGDGRGGSGSQGGSGRRCGDWRRKRRPQAARAARPAREDGRWWGRRRAARAGGRRGARRRLRIGRPGNAVETAGAARAGAAAAKVAQRRTRRPRAEQRRGGHGAAAGGTGGSTSSSRCNAATPATGTYFVDATAGSDTNDGHDAGDRLADAGEGERDDVPARQRDLLQGGRRWTGRARAQGLGVGGGADRRRPVRHREQAAHRGRRADLQPLLLLNVAVLGDEQPRAHQRQGRARATTAASPCAAATSAC